MSLDLKKKQLELKRVTIAREEMELKILEREEEIKRLESHIQIQVETEIKLQTQIDELKKA